MQIRKENPTLEQAAPLVAEGFVQPISPELIEDTRQHLRAGDFAYSIFEDKTLGGFAVFRLLPNNILMLIGMMLGKNLQGRGIAGQVIKAAQQEYNCEYLALRTQSPRMWLAARKLCNLWFPHSDNGGLPAQFAAIAETIRENLGDKFCYPLVPYCYGQPLYGAKPIYRNPAVQSWWDSICDLERGDAVLCIGKFI
ncbi:MAG: GNAT family N-acetyltransferase [Parcubacteria group bacterium]